MICADLEKLYYAFIHTHLNFGLLIWSATPKSNLTKLIRIQNKAIRLLAGAGWKTHAPPLYSKLNILSLNKLTTHVIAKFMHKHYLGKLPKNFNDYFTLVSSVHFRTTRNSLKLYQHFIPQFPTNKLQRGIKYIGSKIWNSVPEELKKLNPHTQFINVNIKLIYSAMNRTLALNLQKKSFSLFCFSLHN